MTTVPRPPAAKADSKASRPSSATLVRRILLPLLLLVALAGGGYWSWQRFYAKPGVQEQYQFATVQRGALQDLVTATGTVQPRDYVDVGAQVSGQLRKLEVEVGTVVESGDLLAQIDPTVYLANVDARRAGLRNQKASLTERESALALATLQANRQRSLMAADATTAEQLQIAEAAVRAAKAQIEAIKAQIDQTESTLRGDEANLSYAKIYAPMAGTVVSVTARQGQTLNTNQSAPTILRIADLSTMTVQTQVSEAEVSKLRQGMEVYFTTLGNQQRRWYGQLRKVEPTPTVTNNVVLYNALFDVPNTNNALMPNMSTQVFFIAASAPDALLVPTAAVTLQRPAGTGGPGARRDRNAPGAASPATSATSAAFNSSTNSSGNASANTSGAGPSRPANGSADTPSNVPAGRSAPGGSTAPASPDRRSQSVPLSPTAASSPSPAGFENMSREERRAAFERMTPEERQAMRDRRRASEGGAPAAGSGAEAGARAGAATAAGTRDSPSGATGTREATRSSQASGPASPRQSTANPGASGRTPGAPDQLPRSTASTGGFADNSAVRAPRRGTVKVLNADGVIEERQVELGVTTRVQMQVLSGLQEGEQVVVGLKLPAGAQRPGAGGTGQRTGQPGAGGPPPGAGGLGGPR